MKSLPLSRLFFAAGALALLALTGCVAPSTVQTRLNEKAFEFSQLPASQQKLVQYGQVGEGMSKDAVYIAWGAPSQIKETSRKGKRTDTWIYYDYQPVYTDHWDVGFGYGYGYGYGGYYGRHSRYLYDPFYDSWGYGTDVDYVPYVVKKAEFENDRVVFWEHNR